MKKYVIWLAIWCGVIFGLLILIPKFLAKTYVNKKFFFNFTYPSAWSVKSENPNFVSISPRGDGQAGPFINMQISNNPRNYTLDQWEKFNLATPFKTGVKINTQVNNIPAVIFTNSTGQVLAFIHRGYIYVWYLAYNGPEFQTEGDIGWKAVMSSFHFYSEATPIDPMQGQIQPTPQTIPLNTKGWKTFTNTKYAYAVEYPPDLGYGCEALPCETAHNVYFFKSSQEEKEIDIDILGELPPDVRTMDTPKPLADQPYEATFIPLRFGRMVIRIMVASRLEKKLPVWQVFSTFRYLNPPPELDLSPEIYY
jgi:hypothetical protein